ncbi:UDP-N-acetylglucosamine 4,6-dehydratase (inverting) [Candidatus Marinamargulisbacteria bacterium SCGC AAA071-K20]|nr:UDP-N-acetylglucosamine 4,6-dehydratase (inverting) [Candidatus Marinamargulisbacteria bacterium SCGC AAA071-K20]
MFNDKVILVTGGTGSFGKAFIRRVLKDYTPKKLIIFSRDELKQFELQEEIPHHESVRYFLGDIRDKERLNRAFCGVDIIVHTAAMKQVEASEYNPFEAIKTNIIGSENIISEAITNKVKDVMVLSTDKAVSPVNLYGATKLCAEKLFLAANNYVNTDTPTKFSVVRYGNVVGSRGSVIPFFLKKKKSGVLPITDPRMTRFWITLPQAVDFVFESIKDMSGGEIFIPKLPSMNIMDLAKAIGPDCKHDIIGIRPGEKIHELMIMRDEARDVIEQEKRYIIQPRSNFRTFKKHEGSSVEDGFEYSSDQDVELLNATDLNNMLETI